MAMPAVALSAPTVPSFLTAVENPERTIPDGVVLTPESTLRAAEGELVLSLGIPPRFLIPLVWHNTVAGEIEFVTRENGCTYRFSVSSISSPQLPEANPIGILSVTVENTANGENQAVVWTSWRYALKKKESFQGIVFNNQPSVSPQFVPYAETWDFSWSLFFENRAFIRDQSIVYMTSEAEQWEKEIWARRISFPYKDMNQTEPMGYQQFTVTLAKGGKASFRVFVPFRPVSRDLLEPLRENLANL